jgi:hypothetical protein
MARHESAREIFLEPHETLRGIPEQIIRIFGVYLPPTLDEYCSAVLPTEILNRRNKDQVWIRTKRAELSLEDLEPTPHSTEIVTVSQLWLWHSRERVVACMGNDPLVERWQSRQLDMTCRSGNKLRYVGCYCRA